LRRRRHEWLRLALLFTALTLVNLPAMLYHGQALGCRELSETEDCECPASEASKLLRLTLGDGCARAGDLRVRRCADIDR
jgi:hypothetical protein